MNEETDSLEAIAGAVAAGRAALRERHFAGPSGREEARALAHLTDAAVRRLAALEIAALAPDRDAAELASLLAVVATGGYGREELAPFSDIDVTFLVAEEEDALLDRLVRNLFRSLMEVFSIRLGLKVGYAYRSLLDVTRLDIQTATALLDGRLLTGDEALWRRFRQALGEALVPAQYVRQKLGEREAALARQSATRYAPAGESSIYLVEPNIKESEGGLRDIHIAQWVGAVAFPEIADDVWLGMKHKGLLRAADVAALVAASEFHSRLRNRLHWTANRAADVLTRERQEEIAEGLGYHAERWAPVERMMHDFYAHAEAISHASRLVADAVLEERLALDERFAAGRDRLYPLAPPVPCDASFLMDLLRYCQEFSLTPSRELRQAVATVKQACPDVGADPAAGQAFMNILASGRDLSLVLDLATELELLQCILPELGEAFRMVPYDPVHRHTVGFHTLEVIRALEDIRDGHEEGQIEGRRLWSELGRPGVLFLAALLHDVGKTDASRPHSETGAEMALRIGRRLGLDPGATATVSLLVRHHLLMSDTSQLRDLSVGRTIRDFAAAVGNRDMLVMLYLLTYADLKATGLLTAVRARYLEELFYRAEQELEAPAEAPTGERIEKYRTRLTRRLAAHNLDHDLVEAHTARMPVAYLLNTRSEQMALHIRAIEALESHDAPVVEFSQEPGAPYSVLTLCTWELPEPGLLARIAGVLYAHEMGVHSAQVFTRAAMPETAGTTNGRARGVALDTLWVDWHGAPVPPPKRLEVEPDLIAVLRGEPVEPILKKHYRDLPAPIPPYRLTFDNEVAEEHTVIELETPDQPGLLYRATRAIAVLGWDIHSARIGTIGARARDAFYVTDRRGRKLADAPELLAERFLREYSR